MGPLLQTKTMFGNWWRWRGLPLRLLLRKSTTRRLLLETLGKGRNPSWLYFQGAGAVDSLRPGHANLSNYHQFCATVSFRTKLIETNLQFLSEFELATPLKHVIQACTFSEKACCCSSQYINRYISLAGSVILSINAFFMPSSEPLQEPEHRAFASEIFSWRNRNMHDTIVYLIVSISLKPKKISRINLTCYDQGNEHKNQYGSFSNEEGSVPQAILVLRHLVQFWNLRPAAVEFGPSSSQSLHTMSFGPSLEASFDVISSPGWSIQREEQLEYGATSLAETRKTERNSRKRYTTLIFCIVRRLHNVRECNVFTSTKLSSSFLMSDEERRQITTVVALRLTWTAQCRTGTKSFLQMGESIY